MVGKDHAEMVAATIRTIFAQPGQAKVRDQVDLMADMLTGQFPALAELLLDAKTDLTAFANFTKPTAQDLEHQPPIRLNREVKRRTDVVGIFPAQPRRGCPEFSSSVPVDSSVSGGGRRGSRVGWVPIRPLSLFGWRERVAW
jgi:hypothetical protein